MGIEAGRFFVNLGLTGAEKTVSGLAQVNDHFSGLKDLSTEAKLAILAALAGLEQMVSYSGKFGNEITKTTAYLNLNTQALQMWDNAAQRAGATAGQTTKQFESIRNHMLDIMTGNGPKNFMPTLLAEMGAQGQKFTPEEEKGQAGYWAEHPDLLFKHFLQLHKRKGLSDSMLGYMFEGAGIDTDLTARNQKFGAFSDKNMALARQQTISNSDIQKLAQLNSAWKDFGIESERIVKLLSTGLLPIVQKMADAMAFIANFLEAKNRFHELKPEVRTKISENAYEKMYGTKFLGADMTAPKSGGNTTTVQVTAPVSITLGGKDIGVTAKNMEAVIEKAFTAVFTKTISKLAPTAGP